MPAKKIDQKPRKGRKPVQQSSPEPKHPEYIDPKWYVKGTTVIDWLGVVNRDNGPYSKTAFDRALFLDKLDLLEYELEQRHPGGFSPESPWLWEEDRLAYFRALGEGVWKISDEVWKAQHNLITADYVRFIVDGLLLPILWDRKLRIKESQQEWRDMFPKSSLGVWDPINELGKIEQALFLRADIKARELKHETSAETTPKPADRQAVHWGRGPDIGIHRERTEFEDQLRTELGTIHSRVHDKYQKIENLKKEFSAFKLWEILSDQEQKELLTGEFKPRAYARTLTARKFGVTKWAIEKDRPKLRGQKR